MGLRKTLTPRTGTLWFAYRRRRHVTLRREAVAGWLPLGSSTKSLVPTTRLLGTAGVAAVGAASRSIGRDQRCSRSEQQSRVDAGARSKRQQPNQPTSSNAGTPERRNASAFRGQSAADAATRRRSEYSYEGRHALTFASAVRPSAYCSRETASSAACNVRKSCCVTVRSVIAERSWTVCTRSRSSCGRPSCTKV